MNFAQLTSHMTDNQKYSSEYCCERALQVSLT